MRGRRMMGMCWMLALAPLAALAEDDAGDAPVSAILAVESPRAAIVVAEAEDALALSFAGAAAPDGAELQISVESPASAGKYWIGLDCVEPGETLRAQLGLEAPLGLVIRAVLDDSPAKTAGLQVHDVIIQAKIGDAEQKVTSIRQFSELIQSAEAKPILLTLLRGGKPATVTVTPAERPGVAAAAHEKEKEDGPRRLHDDRGRGRRGRGGARPPQGPAKLPDAMQVTFTKAGDDVQVTITMNGSSWTVKDTELDKLPGEVRGSLLRFLGRELLTKFRGPAARHGFHSHHGGPWGRHAAAFRHHRHHRGPALARHRGWGRRHGHFGPPAWAAMQRWMPPHGPWPVHRPAADLGGRLETLVTRLERVLGQHAQGFPGRPGGPGFGAGFGPGFGGGRNQPGGAGFQPRFGDGGPPRGDVLSPSTEDLRNQLRRLQEQQEQISRALRDLGEALERSQRR